MDQLRGCRLESEKLEVSTRFILPKLPFQWLIKTLIEELNLA